MNYGAVNLDVGEPFVKATYKLEGDGPLAYKVSDEVKASMQVCYWSNTTAITQSIDNRQYSEAH